MPLQIGRSFSSLTAMEAITKDIQLLLSSLKMLNFILEEERSPAPTSNGLKQIMA
jgi:hypothetical protein